MRKYELLKGYTYSLFFCGAVAFSSILIHDTNQSVNPYLSVFLTFLICTVWFNLVNVKYLAQLYSRIFSNRKIFFLINILTALNWVTTFEALKYIDPILYISLFMGLTPIFTYFITTIQQKNEFKFKTILISLSIACILIIITMLDKKSLSMVGNNNFNKGVILTVISSIASSVYMIYSKKMETKLALTASQIVGTRFYVLVIYSGLVCLNGNCFSEIYNIQFSNFICLALVSSIIPMYSIQKSIFYIGAVKTSFIIPFAPIFTYMILFFIRPDLPKELLPLLLILTGILFYNSVNTNLTSSKSRNLKLSTDSKIVS